VSEAAGSGVAPARSVDLRVQRVVSLYVGLTPDDLPLLGRVYSEQASFKDPFNDVQGLPAITAIFGHMFATLDAPRFAVAGSVVAGDDAFLTWDFRFNTRGTGARALSIHGASHLRFGPDGRVLMHRDYWDAAEEIYEKLPLIGALMRWLKRRASR
jgi:hypothetical protein